jgi:enamine deaminase RidA (YjgF/YER057c/UK114 family)
LYPGVGPLNKEDVIQGDAIEEQTRLVLDYIGAKLESRGLGFENVVMPNVFLQDLDHFGVMNAIYGEYFHTDPPARATVESLIYSRPARYNRGFAPDQDRPDETDHLCLRGV